MSRDFARLARPTQWTKNLFVLAPLLFSRNLFHADAVARSFAAFAVFCFLSSGLYAVNDALDAERDREHPVKRWRPVAAGRISKTQACLFGLLLAACAGLLATMTVGPHYLTWLAAYLINGLAYNFKIKNHVIADVICIAIGFTIRLLAGCAAIDVHPSSWILVCGFSVALVLGFGKRRMEVVRLHQHGVFRPTLLSYSEGKLDLLLGVTSGMCVMSYMLYAAAPESAQRQGSGELYYTVPFVIYGVFRYCFKAIEGADYGPAELLVKDYVFVVNGILWVISVLLIVYF
jgi:4-hydroxybenzoate polyprenyltransferase